MTQYEIAFSYQRTGVGWTRSQVAAFEAGNRPKVDIGLLVPLASTFGVPITDLFEGDGYLLLGPGLCQTRKGFREALSGTPVHRLDRDDQPMFFDPEKKKTLRHADLRSPREMPADIDLAKRLDVDVREVLRVAREMFNGRTLTEERDRRVEMLESESGETMGSSGRQAHRGHITRELTERITAVLRP